MARSRFLLASVAVLALVSAATAATVPAGTASTAGASTHTTKRTTGSSVHAAATLPLHAAGLPVAGLQQAPVKLPIAGMSVPVNLPAAALPGAAGLPGQQASLTVLPSGGAAITVAPAAGLPGTDAAGVVSAASLLPASVLSEKKGSQNTYTISGPCSHQRVDRVILMPPATGCKLQECVLKVVITLPANGKAGVGACPKGPFPVVWFFSGFGSRAGFYKYIAERLASYGYAVVQYNVQSIITPDAKELRFLPPLRLFLEGESNPGGALAGLLDFQRQVVAGHSRGGKLAALHLAQEPNVYSTAVLIDPVDNTIFSPESELYPNAGKALATIQPPKKTAVIGSGVSSLCNPANANYTTFYSKMAAGSWLEFLPGATHADFAAPLNGLIPIVGVCGKGTTAPNDVQVITAATTTAWLENFLRGAPVDAFKAWLAGLGSSTVSLTTKSK